MDKVIVEISARHVHLAREHVETLFGAGYQLTNKKDLSQPGQFACEEKVTVIGPKGSLKCSILGPERPESQIEISLTEARQIGVKAPVRESGDTAGTPGCILEGPCGKVELSQGVMAAKRHLHITPEDAEKFGVSQGQNIGIALETEGRSLTFGDVVVRVSPKYATAVHLDTDEANAAALAGEARGAIVK